MYWKNNYSLLLQHTAKYAADKMIRIPYHHFIRIDEVPLHIGDADSRQLQSNAITCKLRELFYAEYRRVIFHVARKVKRHQLSSLALSFAYMAVRRSFKH